MTRRGRLKLLLALPAVVLQIAGYLTVAGAVATAVSQATTSYEDVE